MSLSPQKLQRYQENGFLGAMDLFTEEVILLYRNQFDKLEMNAPGHVLPTGIILKNESSEIFQGNRTKPQILQYTLRPMTSESNWEVEIIPGFVRSGGYMYEKHLGRITVRLIFGVNNGYIRRKRCL